MRIKTLLAACAILASPVARGEIGVSLFLRTGQPAPGFTSDAQFSVLDLPFITPGGDVLFGADVTGAGLSAFDNTGVFFGKSAPELVAAVRETGSVRGVPGVRHFELSSRPLAAAGGRLAFAPGFIGAGVSEANDGSISTGAPGALELVARESQAASGTATSFAPDWIIAGTARTPFDTALRAGSGGRVGFRARLANSPVTGDTAYYTRTTGSFPSLVALEGALAPGTSGAVFADPTGVIFSDILLNGAGVCVFRSFLSGTSVTALNNEALFRGPAGGPQVLLRRGDLTPPGGNLRWVNFIPQGLNDAGDLLFTSQLQNSAGAIAQNDSCLWMIPQAAALPSPLIREGASLPGSLLPVFETTAAVVNSSGTIAVQVTLGTDFSNGIPQGIWKKEVAAPFSLIARTGQQCPGLPTGILFQDFDANTVQIGAAGHVAFRCTVGTARAGAVPSVWATDSGGQLWLVARVGDAVPEGSTPRTIVNVAALNTNSSGGEDGRNRVISNAGKLVLRVQLNGPTPSTQAILLADLAGLPNTPPSAGDDDFTIRGATRLDVLANDMDPDGDSLRVLSVKQPEQGSVSIGFDNVSYTPGVEFDGDDSFSYTVSDGRGGTATAKVTVHNPFVPVRGTFTTTISRAGLVVGTLTVTLSSSGSVSGKLTVDGVNYAVSGLAEFDRQIQVTVKGGGKPPLDLTLSFGIAGGSVTITGSGTAGMNGFEVDPGTVFSRTDLPQAPAGRYTFLLPGGSGAGQPHGTGWLAVVVRQNGSVRGMGRLPDNTPISFGTNLRSDATVPVSVRVYKTPTGSMAGELTFNAPNLPAASGTLIVTKPAGAKPSALFPDGFTLQINTSGNLYLAPAAEDFALNFTNAKQPLATAQFSDGGLSIAQTQQLVFKRGDTGTATDPVGFPVKVRINRATGVMTGNFTPPKGAKMKTSGVVVDSGDRVEGLFSGVAQTGDVVVQPN